ncbi:MAG: hypothetical protein PHW18_02625 [Sulfuricurvum sp.]|uniref:hypothetical protein n=1 Tax=Sulfuricurvum sp. TaxID=2025608 RepID=UPI00261EF04F|nr:hypothetical protein [Sulfuricurvum sp.]MDD2828451.1 hypothetical protein [Sulfuricurvum sp.]MDD4949456.1 hypothetical protein [Sulfuricurvum sp.]
MGKIRLIFHIGAGKTGTSSIQQTLKAHSNFLKKQGIWYVGLMLEGAEERIYDWQRAAAIEDFHALTDEEIDEQLLEVFKSILSSAKRNNIHTIIWSNESFYSRNQRFHPCLKKIEQLGIDIEIVAYVRRYDSWSRSAYAQWGIKHKTYMGEIRPFKEWIKARMPNFYTPLKIIEDEFPGQLKVRNMDAVKDAVKDFLQLCDIDPDKFENIRSNESLSNEELFLRALFNNRYENPVLPDQFDRVIASKATYEISPAEYMATLLPQSDDMQMVMEATENDRTLLNELLKVQGQEPVKGSASAIKSVEVNSEKLLFGLCEIMLQQSIRIQRLEKTLRENHIVLK